MRIHKWIVSGIATCVMAMGGLVLFAGSAQASFSGFSLVSSFSTETGQSSEGIAIDESTNDVYVYSFGVIQKFDADGHPVNFSSLGSHTLEGVGIYGEDRTEMAVDNSSGPAKGDLYLAGGSGVQVFSPSGEKLGELTQAAGAPWGEYACGVAVDGSGNVYVGLYEPGPNAHVNEYTPTTNTVSDADYVTSHNGLNEVCAVAASHTGTIYAATWTPTGEAPVVEFDSIRSEGTKEITPIAAGTLAVANSASAELFVSEYFNLVQFDSSGDQLSSFTSEGFKTYGTLGVNAKNGRLYTYARGPIQIWQGVLTPDVQTTQTTSLSGTGSATLNGAVSPEGMSVESCSFEYGLSSSYESEAPCTQAMPLTGSSLLPVSAGVSGLLINHEYHYRLSATDSKGTFAGSDRTFLIPVLPTVEDQQPAASGIARASAKLSGTINPEEADTSYHFEYGPTESYGNNSSFGQTGVGSGELTVSQQLRDLIPNTTYHYRLVAKNVAGLVSGADHTFTTGAATPPAVATGGPSGVAQNTATITGTVGPEGLPTTYGFEIGTSTDYGPPTGLGPVGAGLSEAPVSLSLVGLTPGTTYHYRITATNIDGTTYGADETFTTGVFASTFAEPPAPLPFVTVPAITFPGKLVGTVAKKKVKAKAKKARGRGKAKGKKKAKSRKKK